VSEPGWALWRRLNLGSTGIQTPTAFLLIVTSRRISSILSTPAPSSNEQVEDIASAKARSVYRHCSIDLYATCNGVVLPKTQNVRYKKPTGTR
jgi:hypothetical protein